MVMEISKEKLRKIVYIITLPDLGGAQSHLYEVMVNINKYGYQAFLITGRGGWLTNKLEAKGIACYVVPDLVRPISPIHDYKAVGGIERILQQVQPALVHCHSSKAGIIGRIAAFRCHIPSVFTAHGWSFTDGVSLVKRKLYSLIENIVGYGTNIIICVSEYDRKLGVQHLPAHKDKMVTVHNCIPDMPECVRDWEHIPLGEWLNIIVVARFSPPKKNIQILHLLRRMLDMGEKITITFVGDGPELAQAKEEASKLKLENNTLFLGARTDVPQILPKYDLFLLLSNWEGFPISILEAMRAGLPVIASNVGGVNEALKDGENGFLIDVDDNNLLEKIREIKDNKKLLIKMGMNSRERYRNEFLSDKMIIPIAKIYNQIIYNC